MALHPEDYEPEPFQLDDEPLLDTDFDDPDDRQDPTAGEDQFAGMDFI